ncbi:ATP-binding protein [Streptomyces anulatus]|uniref:ATP-binding protein n=1 Tax=Streptomyces anulatus TaxID=1892 RepID=UPI001C25503D|nr:ATP-binding protein [Streptomyces anulatus]
MDLVAMLCCVPVDGLDGAPDEVMLQKSSLAPLDDVVLIREQGAYRFVLERQVKKTLDIQPSRNSWKGLIDQCLRSLREHGDDIDAGRRRLGITARRPIADLENLKVLARRAGAQNSRHHFVVKVLPSMGDPYQKLWKNLKTTVETALLKPGQEKPTADEVETTAFRIVRRFVVEIEYGRRFESLSTSLTEHLIPVGERYCAEDLFSRMYELAMEWIPNEGSITRQMLRDRLSAWFILRSDPPARADLRAAEAMTDRLLSGASDTCLGDEFRLHRASAQQGLIQALADHQQVLVTGPAGTGKSTLAREVAEQIRRRPGATVIGMSLTEQNWSNLADIDRELGPHARFGNALAGAPTGERLLLIDGAEQALTDSGTLLRGVLALIPRDENGRLLWQILAVARKEAASTIRQILADGGSTAVETASVGDLGTEEVRSVLSKFPQLRPLERSRRSAWLLRNLYMVGLLSTQPGGDVDFGSITGEEDVVRLVYERLVRRDDGALRGQGAPDDRQLVYLEAAAAQIHRPERYVQLAQGSAEARQGLVSDGVLTRKSTRHGFAHDVMLDYAVALWAAETPTPDLASVPRPRRLLRAIRLWGQMLLADAMQEPPGMLPVAWDRLTRTCAALAQTDDGRWTDVPFEALFHLGPAEAVMAHLEDQLLDEDGGRGLVAAAERRLTAPDLAGPLLGFLVEHARDLDGPVAAGALRLMGRWARHMPPGQHLDTVAAVATWCRRSGGQTKGALLAFAVLAQHLGPQEQELFGTLCDGHPAELEALVNEPVLAGSLARHRPGLLVQASRAYYLNSPDPALARMHREGVRHTLPLWLKPSSIGSRSSTDVPPWLADAPDAADVGPFSALLAHAPEAGIALAAEIADAATEAVTRIEAERGQRIFTLTWPLEDGERTFRGPGRAWEWAWAGSEGPNPARAGLSALRRWAHHEAGRGGDLTVLVRRILGSGHAIALVAIAVEVLGQPRNLLQVGSRLDHVLGQLDLWELPDCPETRWDVAMAVIVLRYPERQDYYRRTARALENDLGRRYGPDSEKPGGRCRAAENVILMLDASNWTFARDANSQTVPVNTAVRRRMKQEQERTEFTLEAFLEYFSLRNAATAAAESPESPAPPGLYEQWRALSCGGKSGTRPEDRRELDTVVGAVVARDAARGTANPTAVGWAAGVLLEAAERLAAAGDGIGYERWAAAGLVSLAASPDLCAEAAVPFAAVHAAVKQLAGSPAEEVRVVLCGEIDHVWNATSPGSGAGFHDLALELLTEVIATAGQAGNEHPVATRIPEPLPDALSTGVARLDYRLAAAAVRCVHALSGPECRHSQEAARLAEALTLHDRTTWADRGRELTTHAKHWRHAHDAVTAAQAVDGDRARLDAYLEAFATTPSALASVLLALAAAADTTERVDTLTRMWPEIMDRFAGQRDRELCVALLPRPVEPASWRSRQAKALARSWSERHAARPVLAEHLIAVLTAHDLLMAEAGLVLDVLGDQPARVYYSSTNAVAFLAQVVTPTAAQPEHSRRAQRLLDGLIAVGSPQALRAQQHLEDLPGP